MKLMKNRLFSLIALFILSILILLPGVCPTSVRADNSAVKYSSVMDDLTKDETFSTDDYPSMTLSEAVSKDTPLLQVIQIAESSRGELFLYVYQPVSNESVANDINLKATSISMSLHNVDNPKELKPTLYDLECVSSSEVFYKYLVKDFTISDESVRYYNIVSIYRNFISGLDGAISGSVSEKTGISISVGQSWRFFYFNDKYVCQMGTFETLNVDVTFLGKFYLEPFPGLFDWTELRASDSWFIFFNIPDYVVNHIYDADLIYDITCFKYLSKEFQWKKEKQEVSLSDIDKISSSFDPSSVFHWNRILSSNKFKDEVEKSGVSISDECSEALEKSQWVFSFLETDVEYLVSPGFSVPILGIHYSLENVTVLRLHFLEQNNKFYDLGVVSDKVTPDDKYDGGPKGCDLSALKFVFIVLLLILLLWILGTTGLLSLFIKGLVFIITAPFKFIKWLIDKFRGD